MIIIPIFGKPSFLMGETLSLVGVTNKITEMKSLSHTQLAFLKAVNEYSSVPRFISSPLLACDMFNRLATTDLMELTSIPHSN